MCTFETGATMEDFKAAGLLTPLTHPFTSLWPVQDVLQNMPVSQSGAASNHSCCSQCQFLPEQINTASGKWYAAIDLENAAIPCPIGRGHQKQL